MSCQEEISKRWAYYTSAHLPPRGGTRDEGRGERDTAKRKSQGQAARGAVLRSLDFPFFPCLKVVKRSERTATPLGAPQILSTGGLPNDTQNDYTQGEIKTTPLTLKGTGGCFYLEGGLLITCSVSYSKALTCLTDLGMVYHLARPALRTVLTSSCPPSGRCSMAIQER